MTRTPAVRRGPGARRLLSLAGTAAALLLAAFAAGGAVPAAKATEELRVLIWPEYVDPEVVAEFEAEFGATVRFTHFEHDDERDDILVKVDGHGFDVGLIDHVVYPVYVRRGWLAPVDAGRMPNLRHIDPGRLDAFGVDGTYGVPYAWGAVGIAYRADLADPPPRRWTDLLRPPPWMRGRIAMVGTIQDMVAVALMALGHSVNTDDPAAIEAAGRLLLEQQPDVLSYSYVSTGPTSVLLTGEARAALAYNGDAAVLHERDPNVAFVYPEEGSYLWVDLLAVFATSARRRLAEDFIDFLNRPEIAARNATYFRFATPNLAARALIDPALRSDPLVYPPEERLARFEVIRLPDTEVQRLYNRIAAALRRLR